MDLEKTTRGMSVDDNERRAEAWALQSPDTERRGRKGCSREGDRGGEAARGK